MEILHRSLWITFEHAQRGDCVVPDGLVGIFYVPEPDANIAKDFYEFSDRARPPSLPTATT